MKKNNIIILLVILMVFYIIYKIMSRSGKTNSQFSLNPFQAPPRPYNATYGRGINPMTRGECQNPKFTNLDINGRECAGSVIRETKVLKFGDQGCDVLLLQQRLNSMESDKDILEPTGQFNCRTKDKLMRLMGAVQISLIQFQPDDQIGFNELRGGNKITPYSYMDAETIKK
jgi:hypothetical protein